MNQEQKDVKKDYFKETLQLSFYERVRSSSFTKLGEFFVKDTNCFRTYGSGKKILVNTDQQTSYNNYKSISSSSDEKLSVLREKISKSTQTPYSSNLVLRSTLVLKKKNILVNSLRMSLSDNHSGETSENGTTDKEELQNSTGSKSYLHDDNNQLSQLKIRINTMQTQDRRSLSIENEKPYSKNSLMRNFQQSNKHLSIQQVSKLDDNLKKLQQQTDERLSATYSLKSRCLSLGKISSKNEQYYTTAAVNAFKDFFNDATLFRQHVQQTFDCLTKAKNIEIPSFHSLNSKISQLHQYNSLPLGRQFQKTIVFDLVPTLVYCGSFEIPQPKVGVIQIGEQTLNIYLRPYAIELLESLRNKCNLIIFSSLNTDKTNDILRMTGLKDLVDNIFGRESTTRTKEGYLVKDIRIFNQSLKDIAIVDCQTRNFIYQIQNGVPILPYYGSVNDVQLLCLQEFLLGHLLPQQDFQRKLFSYFQFLNWSLYPDAETAVNQLYTSKKTTSTFS